MLRTVYPTLLDEYDVPVRSYLDVLADDESPATAKPAGTIALHDSCVYARREGVVEEPRKLLAGAGLEVLEPRSTGRLTWAAADRRSRCIRTMGYPFESGFLPRCRLQRRGVPSGGRSADDRTTGGRAHDTTATSNGPPPL
jgi:hypothetical protein